MATKSSPLKSIHDSGTLSGGTASASVDVSVARSPPDRRPMRPVRGSDFEHQRPRAGLIRDLHSQRKIAADGASRPARVRSNQEIIPDGRSLLAGRESHERRGQHEGNNDKDP